tara:strand:- start:696 stop:1034 length:339 start_codon:yes stop_codon:yes gene_type:complete
MSASMDWYQYKENINWDEWLGNSATAEEIHAGGLEAILKYIKEDRWPEIEIAHLNNDDIEHDECIDKLLNDESYKCFRHDCCAPLSCGVENFTEMIWEKICLDVDMAKKRGK